MVDPSTGRAIQVNPPAVESPQNDFQRFGGQPWNQPPGFGEPPLGEFHAADGVRLWRGSADAQSHRDDRCPRCGSGAYLSEIVAGVGDGQGGESGKRSAGFCMGCGYRNGGRGMPSEQLPGGIRAYNGDTSEIPVEPARMPYTPEALRFRGKPGIIARVRI